MFVNHWHRANGQPPDACTCKWISEFLQAFGVLVHTFVRALGLRRTSDDSDKFPPLPSMYCMLTCSVRGDLTCLLTSPFALSPVGMAGKRETDVGRTCTTFTTTTAASATTTTTTNTSTTETIDANNANFNAKTSTDSNVKKPIPGTKLPGLVRCFVGFTSPKDRFRHCRTGARYRSGGCSGAGGWLPAHRHSAGANFACPSSTSCRHIDTLGWVIAVQGA